MGKALRRPSSALIAIFFCALGAPFVAGPAAAQEQPDYRITKTIQIGSPDRWDYLLYDSSMNRVYVSHGNGVTVVDATSGKVIGDITGISGGTHGIAITTSGNGFTDDGRAGEAVEFNPRTLKVIRRVKALKDADGIAYDPKSDHVFVADGDPGMVTVINGKTGKPITNVNAGGKVEFLVAGDNGKLYVNGEAKNEIVRIDIATNKADAHWPMPGCRRPHGLAIDAANAILFSTCGNKKAVLMDANTGQIIETVPVGEFSDAARFDPTHKLFFSSNFDGTLDVIAEEGHGKFKMLPTVKTAFGARTMAIDPKTGRIFMTTADFKINKSAPPTDRRRRYQIVPGTVKLLILDR